MSDIDDETIQASFNSVLEKIGAHDLSKKPMDQLVAVTKTFDEKSIEPVLKAGQRMFGENRVQEALSKWPVLKGKYSGCQLHLIGPLQTNKVKAAVALFDVIQTLDRPKLALALSKEMEIQNRSLSLFIQVNTGNEAQKSGVTLQELSSFLAYCIDDLNLEIAGLMCIPPRSEDAKKHFDILVKLAAEHGLSNLSMGMSADFEVALESGATHVRVGSAIFGGR